MLMAGGLLLTLVRAGVLVLGTGVLVEVMEAEGEIVVLVPLVVQRMAARTLPQRWEVVVAPVAAGVVVRSSWLLPVRLPWTVPFLLKEIMEVITVGVQAVRSG